MKMNIIDKLKRIMVIEGINQKQLSAKLNVSQVAVSRYFSGKRKITIEFAVNVSRTFNVSLDWLLKDEDK